MSNRIIEIPNGGGSSGTLEQALMFAASDETSDLAVGTDLLTFAMPFDITLKDVRAFVVTAPTGANLEVDILKNGVSILSTNITIDAGENNSENAATPPVISDTSLSKDDVISVDLIQVGSTVAGAGLKITLAYEAQANVSGGGGELEYQAEITTSTTLTTQEGLNKVYPVNSASDIVITVPQGVYNVNDVINFERRGSGSVEFVGANDNVRLRGVRDVENRYFINDKFSWVSLICRGGDEFSVIGRLSDGYTGAVTTSNYTAIGATETDNVTVTGTGFSDNMLVTITGNATLNSVTVNSTNQCVLNITTSGSPGDNLTIEYDNGDIFTDTDAITFASASYTDFIVAYRLDETSGITVVDQSGTYDATNNGATINQTGKVNKSYSFDGVDDYIDTATDFGLTGFPFSIKYWVKHSDFLNDLVYAISDSANSPTYRGVSVFTFDRKVYTRIGNNGSGSSGRKDFITDNNVLTDNTWHQVVITAADINDVKVYVDSAQQTTNNGSTTATDINFGTGFTFDIGRRGNGPAYSQCELDEIAFWDRVLTPVEISNIFSIENSGNTAL